MLLILMLFQLFVGGEKFYLYYDPVIDRALYQEGIVYNVDVECEGTHRLAKYTLFSLTPVKDTSLYFVGSGTHFRSESHHKINYTAYVLYTDCKGFTLDWRKNE